MVGPVFESETRLAVEEWQEHHENGSRIPVAVIYKIRLWVIAVLLVPTRN